MTNEDKQTRIRPWIDPEERITVHFLDAPDLNTTVTNCRIKRVGRLYVQRGCVGGSPVNGLYGARPYCAGVAVPLCTPSGPVGQIEAY